MALLNNASGKQPASGNADLLGDDTADQGTDDQASDDQAQDDQGTDDDEPTVLCTILRKPDGSLTLVTGDEPDTEDGLAAPEGASPAEGGTPALPEGESFDDDNAGHGKLLKGVLDLLRGGRGVEDGAQADFQSGFDSKKTQ